MLFKMYLNGVHHLNLCLWPGLGDDLTDVLKRMAFLGRTVHIYDEHCKMWYQWVGAAPSPILIRVTDEEALREYIADMSKQECCKTYHDYAYCPTHTSAFEDMDLEKGAALEGFAALAMLVLIIGVFVYWFGTSLFSVTVNFSDIISGLF
jgi:hypothetical protein